MANLIVKPMRLRDRAAVIKMMKKLAAGFGDQAQTRADDLRRYCFGPKKLSSIIVAFSEKKPVGFVITREWVNFYLGAKFCHIDFIFTETRYRKIGVATELIKFVSRTAIKKNCQCLSLDVGIENKNALSLYKKFGLEKRAPLSDHYRLSAKGLKQLAKK